MKPERLSRTVIYENPWVNLYVDKVRFPDGRIIEQHHLLDFEKEAVAVLVEDAQGQVLLVHVYGYTTDSIEWEIPAGSVEEGESMLGAARREVWFVAFLGRVLIAIGKGIMGNLAGKRALITGGASGIGQATAMLFAREGAAVAIADLDEARGETVVQTIRDADGRAIFVLCNVAQAADCQRAVRLTVEKLGGLDILFNNAGIIRRANVLDTTEEEWDQVMAVNVKSIFLMSKYAIPVMKKAGGGVIINTGSGWGLIGGADAVSYCASKGAVVNMTRAMAIDHGGGNIRVNCICPGDTDTGMLRNEARQLGVPDTEFLAKAAARPLGRIGRPEDIAQAALYLASDAASFVTGAVLVVDGGGLAG